MLRREMRLSEKYRRLLFSSFFLRRRGPALRRRKSWTSQHQEARQSQPAHASKTKEKRSTGSDEKHGQAIREKEPVERRKCNEVRPLTPSS